MASKNKGTSSVAARPDRKATVWVAAALMSLGIARVSEAALIAADSFLRGPDATSAGDPTNGEYDVRSGVNHLRRNNNIGAGQNPTVAGFTGAWTGNVTSGTSMAVAQWTAEFDGITPPNLIHPAGGRARWAGGSAVENLQRRVQRTLSPYAPSDTYYMSFLSQVLTDETDLDGFVGIGFTNTGNDANFANTSTTMRGLLIGAAGNGTSTDYVVRHLGATSVRNDVILGAIPQNNAEGSPITRFTVVKVEFNDDPTNVSGNSKITIWQDPTDLTSEADATAAAAPLEFRTFALGTNADLAQMTFLGLDYTRAASFDEPRLGTEWADVAPVPEPASLGVLALGSLALLRRRRT